MQGLRTQRVVLRSAARTSTTSTSAQTSGQAGNLKANGPFVDYDAQSVRLYLNVTVISGAGITLQLRAYDKASNATFVLLNNASAITTTGLYLFELGPNVANSSGNRIAALSVYLPVQWDVNIVHADGASITYSLSVETTS